MALGNMSEGLIRQRRNLISVSGVLIFLKFAGVEISKLSFLGLDFDELKNPSAFYLLIWVAYFYFALRYYQYFWQEGRSKLTSYYISGVGHLTIDKVWTNAKKNKINGEFRTYEPNTLEELEGNDWKYEATYRKADGTETVVGKVLEKKERVKCRVNTIINLTFHTSAVTDYLLPFLFAIGALSYCFTGSTSSLHWAFKASFF
ncbi:hypothetical protein [Marinomonas alcarazii]|uniref:hypothetical protein n=1 Tax=Marinomonas alcarazii TaxID=491949 RepID=UPI0011B3C49B|nr:hypothetical protein [Marinomonas alcarazii]